MTPLVLIHGFSGAPESWDPMRAGLPPGLPVLAINLLGHGNPPASSLSAQEQAPCASRLPGELPATEVVPELAPQQRPQAPSPRSSFEQEVDRIAALIRDRFPDPVHLCGYSLGARLALGLLVDHPALFDRATLIGVHPGLSTLEERQLRASADERWAQLLEAGELSAFVSAWEAQPIFCGQERLEPAVQAAQRRIRSSHTRAGLARAMRALSLSVMPEYRLRLATLPHPVLLVCGTQDCRFLGLALELAGLLLRPSLRLISGAGHNVVLEQPGEVAALLMEGVNLECYGRVEIHPRL